MSISRCLGAAHLATEAGQSNFCFKRKFTLAPLLLVRLKAISVTGLLLILATSSFSQSAFAQSNCNCWINSKTGKAVNSYPYGADSLTDPNRAFRPSTGDNFHRDQSCTWINSKTGKAVRDYPYGADSLTDPNRAFRPSTGDNFHRVVPCPPLPATATTPQPPPNPPEAPTPPPPPETPGHASIPAWQLGLGYAYMHTDGEEVKNLNGVSFSAFYNINSWIGVGGEYSQLRGSTSISAGPSVAEFSLRRRVLLGGIQFDFHPSDTVSISVATLAGRVRDNNKFSFDGFSDSSSASAMAYKIGVGGELRINDSWSVGADANWTPTHFGGQWQHNYGFGAKVIWNLGQR